MPMDQISIGIERMPKSLWQHVKAQAAYRSMTVREAVIEALQDWLKKGKE